MEMPHRTKDAMHIPSKAEKKSQDIFGVTENYQAIKMLGTKDKADLLIACHFSGEVLP